MTRYQITDRIVLTFIIDDQKEDYLFTKGTLEADGNTVWLVQEDGTRRESINTTSIITTGLEKGALSVVSS